MIQPGKRPDEEAQIYTFSRAAEILDLRVGRKKIGRNGMMLILKKCNVLNSHGVAFYQFVEEGYFKIYDKIHQPRVEVRHDDVTLIIGEKGLDFVKKIVVNYLADQTPPFALPTFGPSSGQNIL